MQYIATTGPRPQNLGGFNATENFTRIKSHMRNYVRQNDNTILLSGGALGVDQLWMEIGIELACPVIAVLPFRGYDARWPSLSRQKYKKLLDLCVEVRYACEHGYVAWKLQKRNEVMVDACTKLVAYWNHLPGGTKNCIDYAKRINKPIDEFDLRIILK